MKSDTYHEILLNFSDDLERALRNTPVIDSPRRNIREIIFCGMGGSGIAGDMLHSLFRDSASIPFSVVKDYSLPNHAGSDSLVILSSYSGRTEETLAAYDDAVRRKSVVLTISSDFDFGRRAGDLSVGHIPMPEGFQPRQALAYSIVPLYLTLSRILTGRNAIGDIQEAIRWTGQNSSVVSNSDYFAAVLELPDHPVVIYSSELLSPIAARWRCQLAENSKIHAVASSLPEMNHNEIMGWETGDAPFKVIFLINPSEHPRITRRFEFLNQLIAGKTSVKNFHAGGKSLFAKMISLTCIGDWFSLHLAEKRGVDPSQIATIQSLKTFMTES